MSRIESFKRALDENSIELPYTQLDVHISGEKTPSNGMKKK